MPLGFAKTLLRDGMPVVQVGSLFLAFCGTDRAAALP
jgi:hypothetical protein